MAKQVDLTFPYIFDLNSTTKARKQIQSKIDIHIDVFDPNEYFTMVFQEVVDGDRNFDVTFGPGSRHPIESMKINDPNWVFVRNQTEPESNTNSTYSKPKCKITKTLSNNLSSYTSRTTPSNLHSIIMEIIADVHFDNPLVTDPIINDAMIAQNVNNLLSNIKTIWELQGSSKSNQTALIAKRDILEQFLSGDPPNLNNGTLFLEKGDKVEIFVDFENIVQDTSSTIDVDNITILSEPSIDFDETVVDLVISSNGMVVVSSSTGIWLWSTDNTKTKLSDLGSGLLAYNDKELDPKLYAYTDKMLRVYDLNTNTEVFLKYFGHTITQILTINEMIFVSQVNTTIRVIDGTDYETKQLLTTTHPHHEGKGKVSFDATADGMLVSASDRDTKHCIWDYSSGEMIRSNSMAHETKVIRFCSKNRMISCGSNDSLIKIWDVESFDLLINIDNIYKISTLCIIDGGGKFICGDEHGSIKEWGVDRGNLISTNSILQQESVGSTDSTSNPIVGCIHTKNGVIVGSTQDGRLYELEETVTVDPALNSFETTLRLIFELK
jgi:hypothetical protein